MRLLGSERSATGDGSALSLAAVTARVTNSTFVDNTSTSGAGAIAGGGADLRNLTFAGNSWIGNIQNLHFS